MDKSSAAYKDAVKQANAEYGPKSSIYRSGRIVTLYKSYGGVMAGPKRAIVAAKDATTGLTRWFRERWVQVIPYLEEGVAAACGAAVTSRSAAAGKACRPLRRVTADTPITIGELLKLHKKSDIIKTAKAKERDPSRRVLWKTLTVCKA